MAKTINNFQTDFLSLSLFLNLQKDLKVTNATYNGAKYHVHSFSALLTMIQLMRFDINYYIVGLKQSYL